MTILDFYKDKSMKISERFWRGLNYILSFFHFLFPFLQNMYVQRNPSKASYGLNSFVLVDLKYFIKTSMKYSSR